MTDGWARARRTSGFRRFVTCGAGDAVHRLGRLTSPESVDETGVALVLARSTAVRSVDRIVNGLEASARTSVFAAWWLGRRTSWLNQSPVARERQIGVFLMTAAIVHLALSMAQGHPAGWLWLVVPAVAAAAGAPMACASSRVSSVGERR